MTIQEPTPTGRNPAGGRKNQDGVPIIPQDTLALLSDMAAAGLYLCEIPRVNGKPTKGPRRQGWNQPKSASNPHGYSNDIEDWLTWLRRGSNLGLCHAPSGTTAFDIDHKQETEKLFRALGLPIDDWLNDPNRLEIQSGKPNRGKLIFRMPDGVTSPSVKLSIGNRSIFEIRQSTGEGKTVQDVVIGIHPDTMEPYQIVGGFGRLPFITPELLGMAQNWNEWRRAFESLHTPNPPLPDTPAPPRGCLPIEGQRDPVSEFNATHDLHGILVAHGYTPKGGRRYLRPDSTSGMPGLLVSEDGLTAYSFGGDTLGDGKRHDAFDLHRILSCGGDWSAALAWNPDITAHNQKLWRESRQAAGKVSMKPLHPPRDRQLPPAKPTAIFNAIELIRMQFRSVQWAIPGLLPSGLSLLAGSPKTGKSWLALDFCIAVASGGKVLGGVEVDPGRCLFLALEDNPRRLQKRLVKRLQGGQAPDGLDFSTDWPRADEGGMERLDGYLSDNPGTRLVVIDTLARIKKPAGKNESLYDADYAIGKPLLDIAARHDVAILLITHTRKAEDENPLNLVSGSTGLTGGVDNVLVLKRIMGANTAILHVTGRDIENDGRFELAWDSALAAWSITGEGLAAGMSPERRRVFEAIRQHEPISGRDIASVLNPACAINRASVEWANVRKILKRLRESGLVFCGGDGHFRISKETPSLSKTTVHTAHGVHTAHTPEKREPCEGLGVHTRLTPNQNDFNHLDDACTRDPREPVYPESVTDDWGEF